MANKIGKKSVVEEAKMKKEEAKIKKLPEKKAKAPVLPRRDPMQPIDVSGRNDNYDEGRYGKRRMKK